MAHVLEGISNGLDPKTVLKGELLIWRTKNQARDQGIVQLKKFNLLQMSPNWFLGNWTLDPGLKWALVCYVGEGIVVSAFHPWTSDSTLGPGLEGTVPFPLTKIEKS
jgi:hypothetical protein